MEFVAKDVLLLLICVVLILLCYLCDVILGFRDVNTFVYSILYQNLQLWPVNIVTSACWHLLSVYVSLILECKRNF